MGNIKSAPGSSPKEPDKGRRSFVWKVGAGISAVLATAAPVFSKPGTVNDKDLKTKVDRLSRNLDILEDENSIRRLHRVYETCLDDGMYDNVVNLFADNGEVIFNGGIYKGKNTGIHRLYSRFFKSGLTGRRMEPAPGFKSDINLNQETITVSPDRKSANASFSYSMQVGTPIVSESVLVKMARLQGGGIMKWWEGGTCKVFYIKNAGDGSWKIKSLEYQSLAKADYKPGRSYAKPISVPLFVKTYPEDPAGPDKLSSRVRGA